ncbi:MAG: hypothetical protein ACI3U8_01575 [Candidatus Onthomonas sp.]
MPQGYETENDRIRKRLKETLTPREKLANWWFYHRFHVLIGALALLLAACLIWQGIGTPAADYTVGWVGARELDSAAAEQIAQGLAQYGEDLNGDGQVWVEIHQMPVDLAAFLEQGGAGSEKVRANIMALEADMSVCQSVIFLTDDPAAFWAYSGALLYLDGTEPEAGAEDWENMVVAWSQCSGLGEQPVEGALYLGCRGCWQENQQETWEQSWQLWEKLLAANG